MTRKQAINVFMSALGIRCIPCDSLLEIFKDLNEDDHCLRDMIVMNISVVRTIFSVVANLGLIEI